MTSPYDEHVITSAGKSLTTTVLDRCRELGFALAGVCRAQPTSYERELRDWLGAGKHGEMEYLRRNVKLRIDPRAIVPGAKSIICVADRYSSAPFPPPSEGGGRGVGRVSEIDAAPTHPPTPSLAGRGEGSIGRIALYARGDDYHVVMRKRLARICKELKSQFPDDVFRACVDTAPVLEREHAQRAGLGAIGKNTLLIQRGVGSYLLLGEIITTLELEPSGAAEPDPCGTCTRCIDACPTSAISPWSVDATKCISYLTIEHRGEIDPKYHEAMGDWIFGCDICQVVCPHNQPTQRTQEAPVNPAYEPRREGFDLLEVLNWDEEARRQAFLKSAMKRAKLDMMKRNALIAVGNAIVRAPNPALQHRVESIAADSNESSTVRFSAAYIGVRNAEHER